MGFPFRARVKWSPPLYFLWRNPARWVWGVAREPDATPPAQKRGASKSYVRIPARSGHVVQMNQKKVP